MSKNTALQFLLASSLMCALTLMPSHAEQTSSGCPHRCNLKVAVYQPGPYIDFRKVLVQTARALQEDGYLKSDMPLLPSLRLDENENYVKFAAGTAGGCIEFLQDGFYDGRWDPQGIESQAQALRDRLQEKQDVDLIMALGTLGGRNFADSSLGVPVMVMTPSDPESSGIIAPGEFSNKPNVHVQKEFGRTKNELTMFHRIFKFKKLGIMVDADPGNWAGQSLPAVEETARELGFELVRCQGPIIGGDEKTAQAAYSKCIEELSTKSDAVYLSLGNGTSQDDLYSQLKPLLDRQIPTFSQGGGTEVEMGALLSLADMDLRDSGIFEARVAEAICQGKKPEEISQYYHAPLALNLNLETARLIEWKPDFEVLMSIDQVFQTIKRPGLSASQ